MYATRYLKARKRVYVAGGWFSDNQLNHLKEIEDLASESFDNVFLPRKMNLGTDGCDWESVFNENIKHLKSCDVVIASTVEKDIGTIWECGYAHAFDKKIIYYCPNIDKPNLMLGMSGVVCKTIDDIYEYINEGYVTKVEDYE